MFKLAADEAESDALAAYADATRQTRGTIATSWLGETELRRGIRRERVTSESAEMVLAGLHSFEVTREIFDRAAGFDGENLRTLDALHIAVALRAEADEFITYDARQAAAARGAGLTVTSPGAA